MVGRRPRHVELVVVEFVVTFPYGVTLTVVRPGTPGFGGDPGTPQADRDIPGWALYPGETNENTNHADGVAADFTAVHDDDPTVDVAATDQVRDPADTDRLLSLIGDPRRYTNPLTGDRIVEIRLRRNTG